MLDEETRSKSTQCKDSIIQNYFKMNENRQLYLYS
jgi:hypothetical protein